MSRLILLSAGILASAGAQDLPKRMTNEEMLRMVENSNLDQEQLDVLKASMKMADTVLKKKDKLKKLKEDRDRESVAAGSEL